MKTFLKVWLGVSFIAIGIGIGILIIAFASGANWEDVEGTANFTTMNESYEGVENLNMDINCGDIKIVKGDSFNISAKNILEDEVKSYVKDGTWYIQEDESRYNNLFGIKFNLRRFIYCDWDDHFFPVITITLPEGFDANNCTIRVAAGRIEADTINATEGNFVVETGELYIDQLSVSEKSKYKVGVGHMKLKNVTVSNITVDCGTGDFDVDGAVTGDNDIKCGVGSINLAIDGNEEDYSYDVDCGIGDVDIDGKSYKGFGHDILNNYDAANELHLDCGIGNISVEFN